MKNVNSLLIFFAFLLMSNLYSETRLTQIPSPIASIKKYQSLIIDFQFMAQCIDLNDVNHPHVINFTKIFTAKDTIRSILNCSKYQNGKCH
jgi:hypothetical protein